MYRVKKEHLGKIILKGGDKVTLDNNLNQKQLKSLHILIPAYIEEYDEAKENAEKEVEEYAATKKRKRRNDKNTEESAE